LKALAIAADAFAQRDVLKDAEFIGVFGHVFIPSVEPQTAVFDPHRHDGFLDLAAGAEAVVNEVQGGCEGDQAAHLEVQQASAGEGLGLALQLHLGHGGEVDGAGGLQAQGADVVGAPERGGAREASRFYLFPLLLHRDLHRHQHVHLHLDQFVSSLLALLNSLADFAIFLSLSSGRSRAEQRLIGLQAAIASQMVLNGLRTVLPVLAAHGGS